MRKLLNTVYILQEQAYLTLDGENLVCKIDGETKLRIPFENVENIVCFNYLGCSPALMEKCVSKTIPINFISPQGKFLAKVCGETKGNIFLRVQQIDKFRAEGLLLTQNTMAAKFSNCRQLIRRTLHDNAELREDENIQKVLEVLKEGIDKVYEAESIEEIVGIEGFCAKNYFSIFNKLITNKKVDFEFQLRTKHPPLDPVNALLSEDENIQKVLEVLKEGIDKVYEAESIEEIVGIEGFCAKNYFSIFNKLITNKKVDFEFQLRTKHPPLDPVNALLSFVYTLATNEMAAALETVGLDSYIGYCHTLRSGRSSLACDLVEEIRCIVERFVITLLNLKIVGEKDFEQKISGAVWLNEEGRKKVLSKWQEKKRSTMTHPYLKQKIPRGLLPYVQSNLLAKYVRGEISTYPSFLLK